MASIRAWISETTADIKGNAKYEAWRGGAFLLLVPVYHFALKWIGPAAPTDRVVMATVFVAALFFLFSSIIEAFKTSVMDLSVDSTSGPSEQIYLVIRNNRLPMSLKVFCEVTNIDNDPNEIHRGEFLCGWDDGTVERVTLGKAETARVLIASFEKVELPTRDYGIAFQASVLALGRKVWETSRWWVGETLDPPAFHLRVRIVGASAKAPREYSFILRPRNQSGPLELLREPDWFAPRS